MEIRAVLVFKTQPRLSLYHAYDYVCVFKLVHYKGWWWKMVDVPTYDFSVTYKKNGVTLFGSSMRMQTKFYKRDLLCML